MRESSSEFYFDVTRTIYFRTGRQFPQVQDHDRLLLFQISITLKRINLKLPYTHNIYGAILSNPEI